MKRSGDINSEMSKQKKSPVVYVDFHPFCDLEELLRKEEQAEMEAERRNKSDRTKIDRGGKKL